MSSQWLTCHRYNMAYVAYGFAICGHRGSVDYRPPLQPVSQAADRTLEPELWGATADDRCDGSFLNGKPLHKWISMIHFGRGNHMLFLLGFGNYIYRNMNWTSKNRRRHTPGALLYIYMIYFGVWHSGPTVLTWQVSGSELRRGKFIAVSQSLGAPNRQKWMKHQEVWVQIFVRYYVKWYEMIWYDMIGYAMIWYDRLWYDMIWYLYGFIYELFVKTRVSIEPELHFTRVLGQSSMNSWWWSP